MRLEFHSKENPHLQGCMSMSSSNKPRLFVIGYNSHGEFGLNHTGTVRELKQKYTPYSISNIHSSAMYTIYSDHDYKNIWSAGCNESGQCAVGPEAGKTLKTLHKLTFFSKNNIPLKTICVSNSGGTTFFITKNNKLYGCGSNDEDQLGLENVEGIDLDCEGDDQLEPILISPLSDVTDIQSNPRCSIAVCCSDDDTLTMIIDHWCRLFKVPEDIKSLLFRFSKFNKVYSTVYSTHGHGDKYAAGNYLGWREIEALNNKDIIKVSMGFNHSLFLASDGIVYACGENIDGELGIVEVNGISNIPMEIPFFTKNKIRIVDIATSCYTSLALDEYGRIYAWGYNNCGQCGSGHEFAIKTPELIESLREYVVVEIKCGYHLSYCRTECQKHFIWGANDDNECLTDIGNGKYENVLLPHRIDEIIRNKCGTTNIVSVCPGFYSLKILVE